MSKLETLYASIEGLQNLGIPLNDDTLKAVDELEEQLIKTEILPAMSDDIEPLLSQIQRDLVLVVEYHPGEPINVAISRKAKISEIVDAKPLTPRTERKVRQEVHMSKKKAPKTGLCVWLPDGDYIQETSAARTEAEAVILAGIERVASLGIPQDNEMYVSKKANTSTPYASQTPLRDGWLLGTHTSTLTKKRHLEKISAAFNLGWVIEIVK